MTSPTTSHRVQKRDATEIEKYSQWPSELESIERIAPAKPPASFYEQNRHVVMCGFNTGKRSDAEIEALYQLHTVRLAPAKPPSSFYDQNRHVVLCGFVMGKRSDAEIEALYQQPSDCEHINKKKRITKSDELVAKVL